MNIRSDECSDVHQLEDGIIELVAFEFCLHKFVLPIVFVVAIDDIQPFLHIPVNEIDFSAFLVGESQNGASMHHQLLLHDLHVLLSGRSSNLLVHLLHLLYLAQNRRVYVVRTHLLLHLLLQVKNTVRLIVLQYRLHHVFVELLAQLLILPKVPGAVIESVYTPECQTQLDGQRVELRLCTNTAIVSNKHFLMHLLALHRVLQPVFNLLHVEVCKEGVEAPQVDSCPSHCAKPPPKSAKQTHQQQPIIIQMRYSTILRLLTLTRVNRHCFSNRREKQGPSQLGIEKEPSQKEIFSAGQTLRWYEASQSFWMSTSSDEEGVMMGRADLSNIDIRCSAQFIDDFVAKEKNFKPETALDCGAGIGRVGEHLLHMRFKEVDMVQKCDKFVAKAIQNKQNNGYRYFYCCGLETFTFQHSYDCIWIQWVLTHLPSHHVVSFLKRAKNNLAPKGIIVVKQNYIEKGREIDKEDSTIVRCDRGWKEMFEESGLKVAHEVEQSEWPTDLYPVRMWALTG